MKAAVWHGVKDIRVEDVELKPLKSDEVVVKVAWAGICGSDLHEYVEGPVFIPVDKVDELTGGQAPLTMGHEFSGVVEAVGENVTDVKIGDHVTVNPTVTHERWSDDLNVYDGYSFIGLSYDGGFTTFVNVPAHNIYHLPSEFPLKLAATIEPTAVAVQAIKEGSLKFGDTTAIFGAGPIGCLVTAAAKAAGARKIIVCDLSESRLNKAIEMGATDVINSGQVDAVKEIRKLVPSGVDVAFEVAGVQPTFIQAIHATKPRGTMVVVSIFARLIEFNPMLLTNSGVKVTSTIAYSRQTFKQTVDLVTQHKIEVAPIITKEIALNDIVAEGFETLINDKKQAKILVELSGE